MYVKTNGLTEEVGGHDLLDRQVVDLGQVLTDLRLIHLGGHAEHRLIRYRLRRCCSEQKGRGTSQRKPAAGSNAFEHGV